MIQRKQSTLSRFLCVLAIAGIVTCAPQTARSDALDPMDYSVLKGREATTFAMMIDELCKADVVFIGEQHDHKLGHALELEILKALQSKSPKMALSLEMFERDVQLVLDEYLADQISQSSFLAASRPWPNYKTDYAPMVEFCKERKLPVIAANAPRRYVSTTSRKGQKALADLPKESRSYLVKLPYSTDISKGYDQALDEVFGSHGPAGASQTAATSGMPPQPFIKESQMLWDATMADSILKGRRKHRAKLVLQVNGSMHSDNGYGVVDRVRKSDSRLKVMVVSIKPDKNYQTPDLSKAGTVSDYLILTRVEPSK